MLRWVAPLGSGLFAAAAFGFFYWWIDRMHQVNGVGLLRRQDWPLNTPWIWVALGFVIGTLAALRRGGRQREHAGATRALAEDLSREYAETYALPDAAASLPVFTGWSNGRHAMTSDADAGPIQMFDYTTITPGGESDTVTHGTAVLLPLQDVPDFDLRPRTIGWRLLGWAGFKGLTFDPQAVEPADAETVQQFTAGFHLFTAAPAILLDRLAKSSPPELAEQEEAVRRLFTPEVMACVNQYPGHALEARSGFLVVWHGSGVLPAQQRSELWDAAVTLRSCLQQMPSRGPRSVVPGRAGSEPSRQARKMRNTVVGAVVGVFAGFLITAILMPILFFRRPLQQGPGIGFFLEPVLFFGLVLLTAALGAGLGAMRPVHAAPRAEDPVWRQARQRASGWAAVLCGFLGFFGGFFVFVTSKVVFDWKVDDFGIDSALFFGSIFGGAFLGAVLGLMLVQYWYRARPADPPIVLRRERLLR
jgi:hypothetical protein